MAATLLLHTHKHTFKLEKVKIIRTFGSRTRTHYTHIHSHFRSPINTADPSQQHTTTFLFQQLTTKTHLRLHLIHTHPQKKLIAQFAATLLLHTHKHTFKLEKVKIIRTFGSRTRTHYTHIHSHFRSPINTADPSQQHTMTFLFQQLTTKTNLQLHFYILLNSYLRHFFILETNFFKQIHI